MAGTGREEEEERLAGALARLERLVDWERADRSAGAPGAAGMRRLDLGPARDLDRRLGGPAAALRGVVHVAGTKGKGSVASLVVAGLGRAGIAAGLYTSPHVEHVTERVAVGGRPVAPGRLSSAIERALDARDAAAAEGTAGRAATWFDVLTSAAFLVLAEEGVRAAAIECGLGGRLDSTNVLDAEVAVVTNVDLEHTAILGTTRAAIAREKAGIVKPGATVVTGCAPSSEEGAVVREVAAARGAELVHVPQDGTIEERNARLAGAALEALGRRGLADEGGRPVGAHLLDAEAIAAARLPGRLEVRAARGTMVVLDGAHVPSSVALVLEELRRRPGLEGPPVVVLGAGRDKDAAGMLKTLAGRVERVVCSSAGAGPYRTPESLLAEARRAGVAAETAASPRAALEQALARARPRGWVLVTGSLHLVGAVRGALGAGAEDPRC